jgi:hypothetical protein
MFAVRVLVALAAAAAVGIAAAQSPAPAPASAAPRSACVKPDAHPGRLASDNRKKQWFNDANAWRDCMKIHVAALQAQANTAIAAANQAVEDFNRTSRELQEQSDAASGK